MQDGQGLEEGGWPPAPLHPPLITEMTVCLIRLDSVDLLNQIGY